MKEQNGKRHQIVYKADFGGISQPHDDGLYQPTQ